MKHCNFVLILIGAALIMSGCSPLKTAVNPYEEDFKCRAADDTGKCVDTPKAYEEARYPDTAEEKSIRELDQQVPGNRYKLLVDLLPGEKKPLLQPPKILRVLLLPYRGENDELFMTRYVYLKIEDSQWILTIINEK
jgi:conjugal transfer pilus assembly protein TraV